MCMETCVSGICEIFPNASSVAYLGSFIFGQFCSYLPEPVLLPLSGIEAAASGVDRHRAWAVNGNFVCKSSNFE